MKSLISGLMFLVVSLVAFGGEPIGPSERLIKCLVKIESGGNLNAIGDKNLANMAYGPLQVRKPACDDVNRRFGTAYKPEDCLGNLELSIKIFRLYTTMYGTKERLGRVPSDADFARIWNGGPNGWKREATKPYLAKVVKAGGID